jgi:hypothetical protein
MPAATKDVLPIWLVMAGIAVRRTASLPLAYVPAIYVLLD